MMLKEPISPQELSLKQANDKAESVDPRVIRTRQLLEDAFMALINKERFEAITVRDITELAGVNRATFYAHFEDKYALFTYAVKKGFNTAVQARLQQDATLTKENLIQLVLALRDFFIIGDSKGCASVQNQPIRPFIESSVQELVANLLRTWLQATDGLSVRAETEMTATLLSWSIFGYAHSLAMLPKDQVNLKEISKAVNIILYGVADHASENDNTETTPNAHYGKIMPLSGFTNKPTKTAYP